MKISSFSTQAGVQQTSYGFEWLCPNAISTPCLSTIGTTPPVVRTSLESSFVRTVPTSGGTMYIQGGQVDP